MMKKRRSRSDLRDIEEFFRLKKVLPNTISKGNKSDLMHIQEINN